MADLPQPQAPAAAVTEPMAIARHCLPKDPLMDKVTLAMQVPDMGKGEDVPKKLAKAVSSLVDVGDGDALPDDGYIMGVSGDTAFIAGNKAIKKNLRSERLKMSLQDKVKDHFRGMPELVYSEDSSDEEMKKSKAGRGNTAAKWLKAMSHREDQNAQGHVIKIYTLAPFLFGRVFQPDRWIKYACDAGLLASDDGFGIDSLPMDYFKRMEYVEAACGTILNNLWEKKKLQTILELMDKLNSNSISTVGQLIQEAKKEPLIIKWRSMVTGGDTDSCGIVAVVYAARQFCQHVVDYVEKGRNFVEEYNEMCRPQDKDILSYKNKGNTAFQDENYLEAASHYTQGLLRSQFNHVLYGNRAQTYLKQNKHDKFEAALCDSKRCIILQPEWYKGRYRFAQAWFGLQYWERAVEENKKALKTQENSKGPGNGGDRAELEKQCERFQQKLRAVQQKQMHPKGKQKSGSKPQTNGRPASQTASDSDDVPDLASDSGSEDSNDSSEDDDINQSHTVKKSQPQPGKKEDRISKKKEEPKKPVKVTLDSKQRLFARDLKDASEALLGNHYRKAANSYSQLLTTLQKATIMYYDLTERKVMVIKYALGHAYIQIGVLQDIERGVTTFETLLKEQKSVTYFPLAHLGLGRALHKQNRFRDAVAALREGLSILRRKKDYALLAWPGTETAIEETKPGQLQVALRALLDVCTYPPTPDAVCRYEDCKGHHKVQIYFSDPDFQGLVLTECFAHCVVGFHIQCWKRLKSDTQRSDKDILHGPCYTPDCTSKIFTITIYDRNACLSKKMENPEKPDPKKKKVPTATLR